MAFLYIIPAVVNVVSQPQTAGDVKPQIWVIIAVVVIAAVLWFFTRKRRG